jgi:hypothetical protein
MYMMALMIRICHLLLAILKKKSPIAIFSIDVARV